jgi:hypothetical protein
LIIAVVSKWKYELLRYLQTHWGCLNVWVEKQFECCDESSGICQLSFYQPGGLMVGVVAYQ